MWKIFQKTDSFYFILIIFSVFFSFIIFLSIPAVFDYKKMSANINNQIESDYSLNLKNSSKFEYRFFPSPHLYVKKTDLSIDNKSNLISEEIKDLKIFVSILKLYNFKQIKIKKIFIKNANFKFSEDNFKLFLNNLNTNKTKPLVIKNSKFFYIDKNEEVLIISPIKKINYLFNDKTNQSKLKIDGNLFDTDFDFTWSKDFTKIDESEFKLKFSNPNIILENFIKNNGDNKLGKLKTFFLNDETDIKYSFNKNSIQLSTNSNNQFSINGNIDMKPFYFNIQTTVKETKIKNLINNIFLTFFNYKENIHPNFSGDLKLVLKDLNNAYFKSGFVNFNFSDSRVKIINNNLNIKNIGTIIMKNNLFYENKGEIFFVAELEIQIKNQDEFFRRFSIPIKNRKKLNFINVLIEKNIDNDNFTLSNLTINEYSTFDFNLDTIINSEKDYFDNFQKFRNIIKEKFSNIN